MQSIKRSTRQLLPQRGSSHLARGHLQAFDPLRDPPMGAHMLTPRPGYTHHGIYVGRGRVVHYRGFSRGLCRGPVEEVSVAQFSRGNPIWIYSVDTQGADPEEVVRRARLRVGENRYRIFTNNCEHFCEWCIRGESRSYQVDALITGCRDRWQAFLVLMKRGGALKSLRAGAHKGRVTQAALTSPRPLRQEVAVNF